jgi:hypothetical protein
MPRSGGTTHSRASVEVGMRASSGRAIVAVGALVSVILTSSCSSSHKTAFCPSTSQIAIATGSQGWRQFPRQEVARPSAFSCVYSHPSTHGGLILNVTKHESIDSFRTLMATLHRDGTTERALPNVGPDAFLAFLPYGALAQGKQTPPQVLMLSDNDYVVVEGFTVPQVEAVARYLVSHHLP